MQKETYINTHIYRERDRERRKKRQRDIVRNKLNISNVACKLALWGSGTVDRVRLISAVGRLFKDFLLVAQDSLQPSSRWLDNPAIQIF